MPYTPCCNTNCNTLQQEWLHWNDMSTEKLRTCPRRCSRYKYTESRWIFPTFSSLLNVLLQGGEDPYNALRFGSLFAKEPLIIGLFCGTWSIKKRHPMGLGHPVLSTWSDIPKSQLFIQSTRDKVQGGEDQWDAPRSFSTKEPLNIGHFCGKWPIKIRDSMSQLFIQCTRHKVQGGEDYRIPYL